MLLYIITHYVMVYYITLYVGPRRAAARISPRGREAPHRQEAPDIDLSFSLSLSLSLSIYIYIYMYIYTILYYLQAPPADDAERRPAGPPVPPGGGRGLRPFSEIYINLICHLSFLRFTIFVLRFI